MGRDYLGELEQQILLAALQLGDDAYTVSIIRELEQRTGRSPSHGAVYVALRRLERKGMIETHLGEPTGSRGGRPPRLVAVTDQGVEMLREARRALENLWSGLKEVAR
jgi:DNA-binding PadR family transcriptional regulator